MKDVLGNLELVEYHPITGKISESINLERQFDLDCSSDTLSTRGEFGRVTGRRP